MSTIGTFARAAVRLAGGLVLAALTAGPQAPTELAPLGLPLAPSLGSVATLDVPVNASPEQLRDASLRQLGWTETAVSYVAGARADGRARVQLSYLPGQQSACKADWACLTGFFPSSNRVQISIDPADSLFARGFAHEFGHAIDNARGYSDSIAGNVMYDLLELSQDSGQPEAAWGARQILQLRDDDGDRADTLGYHAMLDHKDFSHLSIALLEFGAGNDPLKLPDWFRQAYYPYLLPGTPRLARPVRLPADRVPADIAARTQRVVDLIAQNCGPVLAGARTTPATTCVSHSHPWPDVPYAAYPGAESTGPAAPGVPHAPIVDPVPVFVRVPVVAGVPLPRPIVSHVADQGVSRGSGQAGPAPQTTTESAAPPSPPVDPPTGTGLAWLPLTQPGLSPDEGFILTPLEATGVAYYFVAGGQRFNLTEAEVQAVISANPLIMLLSAPRDRIAQYQEATPPNQGRTGLLEGLDG